MSHRVIETTAVEAYLVQQPDSQSDIHLHLLFFQLPVHTVLHDNIRRVLDTTNISNHRDN